MTYNEKNYLLCTLNKNLVWQVPLDLHFHKGTKVSFTCNGQANVHLTGYIIMEDDEHDSYFSEEQTDEGKSNKKLAKRKAQDSSKDDIDTKRVRQLLTESNFNDNYDDLEEESESDDDTDDSDIEDEVQEEQNQTDSEEDSEEDESNEYESSESSDEDDSEEEDEENERQKQKIRFQQPEKKNKQVQEKQQQQLTKKQDKQKLTNGKETKQVQQNKQQQKDKTVQPQTRQNKTKKREGGVIVEDKKIGNGPMAQFGKYISVHSVGRLQNGKKFSSHAEGDGIKFRLGKGEIIRGWDIGINGMRVGGQRRLTVPPNMGYV